MERRELDRLIERWKKIARALKMDEQAYGLYLTGLLEKRTDAELAAFIDPVEAAVFFCLLDLTKNVLPDTRAGSAEPGPEKSPATRAADLLPDQLLPSGSSSQG